MPYFCFFLIYFFLSVSEIYIELFNNSKATVKMDGKMHFYKLVSPHIDKNTTTLIFHKGKSIMLYTMFFLLTI